jgi:hypothetical protein
MRPEDLGIEPLADESIPDEPPEPPLKILKSEQEPSELLAQIRVVPYLSRQLIESAWRLVELSQHYEGNYRDGKDIPLSSKAASTGAIVLACAAFEACLNEEIFNAASGSEVKDGTSRLLLLTLKLSPRDQLEALAGVAGETVNWGSEPYQSLNLVLSIRRFLLHHEISLYPADQGFWPAKKLRDLPRRIGSPYPVDSSPNGSAALEWHQHVLTPAGAEWAVRVICEVVDLVDKFARPFYTSEE